MDNETGFRILHACSQLFCDTNLRTRAPTDIWFVEPGSQQELLKEIEEQDLPREDKILARGRIWRSDPSSTLSRVDLRLGYGTCRQYHFVMGVRTCSHRRFQLEDGAVRSWVYIKENSQEGLTAIPSTGIYPDVTASRDRCACNTCDCGDYLSERLQNLRFLRRCAEYSTPEWEVVPAWQISDGTVTSLRGYAHTVIESP